MPHRLIILMASGALAALAGSIELFGVTHRLCADNLDNRSL